MEVDPLSLQALAIVEDPTTLASEVTTRVNASAFMASRAVVQATTWAFIVVVKVVTQAIALA